MRNQVNASNDHDSTHAYLKAEMMTQHLVAEEPLLVTSQRTIVVVMQMVNVIEDRRKFLRVHGRPIDKARHLEEFHGSNYGLHQNAPLQAFAVSAFHGTTDRMTVKRLAESVKLDSATKSVAIHITVSIRQNRRTKLTKDDIHRVTLDKKAGDVRGKIVFRFGRHLTRTSLRHEVETNPRIREFRAI